MRIDAHQHFWDLDLFPYPWMPVDPSPLRRNHLPEDLVGVLSENRFDGSIAVQATVDAREVSWLLELADRNPFVLGVVGWVDLTDPDLGATLDHLQKNPKFKGVRHPVHDEPDVDWILRPAVIGGLRELARRNLPFDLLLRPRHLPVVLQLAATVPDLRLVIDHIAKPAISTGALDGWADDMERVAAIPELCVKMSGMITEADHSKWKAPDLAPYVQHVLRCFGHGRLMFGSDWPVCKLAGSWKQVLAAFTQAMGPQPMDLRGEILGDTAERFYNLQGN